MKRLTSLIMALLMLLLPTIDIVQAEEVDAIVLSAPLTKSSDILDGMVRVYLSSLGSVTKLDVTVVGSYSVSGPLNLSLFDGQAVSFAFNIANGHITMTTGGITYDMGSEVTLRRHQADGQSALKIAQANRPNNLYPGDLQLVSRTSGSSYKLYPIVHVYIEYYLYGVVPYEMSSSWPIEALKAQSVAARTYTLNRMNGRESYIYDLVDTSSDQVYNGYVGTETNATRAVDATRGIVIMNDGKLSGTYYTASNGGQTEAVANAWGSTAYPYLNVKDDPFDAANTNTIKRKLVVYSDFLNSNQNATLQSMLLQKAQNLYGDNIAILKIDSITPHTPKYDAPSRLYTKIDFGVTLTNGVSVTLSFDIFGELESALSMSINSSKNELWYVERDGANFVLRAARYGHGIGMSQRGAQQMANMGYTYDQILGFYYQGCERIQYTFTHTILPPAGSGDAPVVSTETPATIAPDSGCVARVQLPSASGVLPLRYTPSNSGKTLICAENGSAVSVLNYNSDWTLIQYGQINGYVPTNTLAFTSTPPAGTGISATNINQWATVTGSTSLNLRDGAGYSSNIIGSIPGGAPIAIFVNNGDWAQVQYGQAVGYCAVQYLTLHGSYPGAETSSGTSAMVSLEGSSGSAPLFSTASTSGTVIQNIDHGTQVTVHSNDGTWCRISVSGVTGYMLASALDFDATGVTPTTPPLDDGEQYAIVASDASTLNLRNGPSTTYDVIAEIPRGTQIIVTSYGSTWCAVRWGSLTGYVMTQYLSFESEETTAPTPTPTPTATSTPTVTPTIVPSPIPTTEIVADNASVREPRMAWINTTVEKVNLRQTASDSAEILTSIPSAEAITILEEGSTWSYIQHNGLTGYVYTQHITYAEPLAAIGIRYVCTETDPLSLRAQPNTQSAILARIPRGVAVTLLKKQGDWCLVQYGSLQGYCAAKYLSPDKPEDYVQDNTRLLDPTLTQVEGWIATVDTPDGSSIFINEWCSTTAPEVREIQHGTTVTLMEKGDIWCLITYEGDEGYCLTSQLKLIAPEQ